MNSHLHSAFGILAVFCAALALDPGPTKAGELRIEGDVKQTTVLGNSTTAGHGATSTFSSIKGGATIKGDVDLTSVVRNHATISAGPGRKAQTSIATIHGTGKTIGKTKRTVMVDRIVNIGGCLAVGSVNSPCR